MVSSKCELATPALVLDIDKMCSSISRMQNLAARYNKKVRPHAKTHKCSRIAALQMEAGATGMCVAKLSEAEMLIEKGITDVLITGPVASEAGLEKLAWLAAKAPGLWATLGNAEVAAKLGAVAQGYGRPVNVLIDVDVGMKRTGIDVRGAFKLAEKIVAVGGLHLRGIQAYGGHLQHIGAFEDRRKASLAALQPATDLFRELRARYVGCEIYTTSGTGTAAIDLHVPEITDFQVGSYLVMDSEYLAVEPCSGIDDPVSFSPALTLLTTVVSTNQHGFVTVDAGLKTIYRHGGVPQVVTPGFQHLNYDWFGDEYGRISAPGNSPLPELGAIIELVVPHCDPTINLFDRYCVLRAEAVVDEWEIDLRGRSQ